MGDQDAHLLLLLLLLLHLFLPLPPPPSVSLLFLQTSARPISLEQQESDSLRRTLSVLQTRLQTYVEDTFSEASTEEKHRIIKILGNRIIHRISDRMVRGLHREEKKDLLARVLR